MTRSPLVFVGLVTLTLAAALGGAALTGGQLGLLNSAVETLSSSASNSLGKLLQLLPLGFAFGAGLVASVNPCGFAMLPAYLGLYLGSEKEASPEQDTLARLGRAALVSAVVTGGFVLLFGVVGVVVSAGARSVAVAFPWIGLGTGVLVVITGAWIMVGGTLYAGAIERFTSRVGDAQRRGVRGYFAFGLGYGIASLSCTLPIFLAVVSSSVATSGFAGAALQFVLYGLGMGVVILVLTVSVALFQGAVIGRVRALFPYLQPINAVLLLGAGGYIVYYWLTIGGLLRTIT